MKNNVLIVFVIGILLEGIAFSKAFPYTVVENRISSYYNIDKKIVRSIIKTESGFSQYAVLIKSNRLRDLVLYLKRHGIRYKRRSFKYVAIFPANKKEAIFCYNNIFGTRNGRKKFHIIDYDAGLMQINKSNFERYKLGLDYYLDFSKNMVAGVYILRNCFDWARRKFSANGMTDVVVYAIECYNKGGNKRKIDRYKYNYARKVLNNYIRLIERGDNDKFTMQ